MPDWEQDKIYLDNVGASVSVLKKLSDEWKVHSAKYASLDPMREAIKSFRQKVKQPFCVTCNCLTISLDWIHLAHPSKLIESQHIFVDDLTHYL